jgi:hypothetical protein
MKAWHIARNDMRRRFRAQNVRLVREITANYIHDQETLDSILSTEPDEAIRAEMLRYLKPLLKFEYVEPETEPRLLILDGIND